MCLRQNFLDTVTISDQEIGVEVVMSALSGLTKRSRK
jgi:hypothetical protein